MNLISWLLEKLWPLSEEEKAEIRDRVEYHRERGDYDKPGWAEMRGD